MSKAEMELREKVKKRGRAYQCLACYQRLGRVYINEKLKVEDHIYRDHVRADEIPFYCRLCRFHCQRLDQLLNHVRNYTPHVEQVRRRGLTDGGKSFLTKSTKPYVISALDYVKLEAEDSIQHWMRVARGNPGARTEDVASPTMCQRTPPMVMTRPVANTTCVMPNPGSLLGTTTQLASGSMMSLLNRTMTEPATLTTPQDLSYSVPLSGMPSISSGQTPMVPQHNPVMPAATNVMMGNQVSMPFGGTVYAGNQVGNVQPAIRLPSPITDLGSNDVLGAVISQTLDFTTEDFGSTVQDLSMSTGAVGSGPACSREVPGENQDRSKEKEDKQLEDHNLTGRESVECEDITEQLLGSGEDFALETPSKRKVDLSEAEDPLASVAKRQAVEKTGMEKKEGNNSEGFSVDRVAVNSLVNIMISLRDCVKETNESLSVIKKAVASNSRAIVELTDSVNKLKKSTDIKEREDKRREEKILNWERRLEEVLRKEEGKKQSGDAENDKKEQSEEARREEEKFEAERKARGEKRRQEQRMKAEEKAKEEERKREDRRTETDRNEQGDKHNGDKEKENRPQPRSALSRLYTENTIKDISNLN